MGGVTDPHFMQAADCSFNFNHFIFLPKLATKQQLRRLFLVFFTSIYNVNTLL